MTDTERRSLVERLRNPSLDWVRRGLGAHPSVPVHPELLEAAARLLERDEEAPTDGWAASMMRLPGQTAAARPSPTEGEP